MTEEITINPSGSAVCTGHADIAQAMAMFKGISSRGNAGASAFDRDMDYSSTLLLLPDTLSMHVVLKPGSNVATWDTRAFINDLSEFQKMRQQMVQQLVGMHQMIGMMGPKGMDSGKMNGDWMRGARLLEFNWSAHEIKRTFNQALYDSLMSTRAAKAGSPGIAWIQPMGMAMMGNNTWKTIFHLPAPAKQVTGDPYTLSEDRKTVTIERKFVDIFKDPKTLTFTIDY
jgi:hypothetical protein